MACPSTWVVCLAGLSYFLFSTSLFVCSRLIPNGERSHAGEVSGMFVVAKIVVRGEVLYWTRAIWGPDNHVPQCHIIPARHQSHIIHHIQQTIISAKSDRNQRASADRTVSTWRKEQCAWRTCIHHVSVYSRSQPSLSHPSFFKPQNAVGKAREGGVHIHVRVRLEMQNLGARRVGIEERQRQSSEPSTGPKDGSAIASD